MSEVGWLTGSLTARLAPVMQAMTAPTAATDVNAAGCVQTSRLTLTMIHKWPQVAITGGCLNRCH
jgi:hypothetical protein